MEAKFLTPIQLWADFNPIKDSLDLSYIKSESTGGYVKKGVYFTSENAPDGKARIYAESVSGDDNKKKPAMIIIGGIKDTINTKFLEYAADCGYIAVSCDYSAVYQYPSKYPESLKRAEYLNAANILDRAEPSAKETPWFVWAKALRRLISVMYEDPLFDRENVGVIGIGEGAILMWQLAAMDGRVKAAASLLGSEGISYLTKPKYSPDTKMEIDESKVNWQAAVSAEAYARFLQCPVLLVNATNSSSSAFDITEDIIGLIPQEIPYGIINCPRLSACITASDMGSIKKWFHACLKKGAFPKSPELKYEEVDGKLRISVNADQSRKIKEVLLYYSYGEINPRFRNWIAAEMVKKENYELILDIYNNDIRHYVFANVFYHENLTLSTPEVSFVPEDLTIIPTQAIKQRIIYDSGMGTDTFTVGCGNIVLPDGEPHLAKSNDQILGITVLQGSLVNYKLGDVRIFREEDSILQLDAFSKEDREIEIIITSLDGSKATEYTTAAALSGGEKWHKLSFFSHDFKTAEMHPLKDWQGVRKLEIKNAAGILFNNIIWV